jgi:hypothetical protein
MLDRQNGFTDAAAVTVEGLPAGVTAAALSIASGQTSGTLALTVAPGATPATTALTVRATGPGVNAATAALSLVVQAAYSFSLSSATISVPQGGQGSVTATITRSSGFTGAVALTVAGLPTGVTGAFNPVSTTGTTSTLTLAATAAAAPGNSALTVNASGVNGVNQSAALTLTVQAAAPNVSVAFCPSIGQPLLVAFQDGPSGAWVRSTPANGVYAGRVLSGRGGIAYVTARTGGGFDTTVRYGSLAELQDFSGVFCLGATGAGKTVNVTLAGMSASDVARVGLGVATSVSAAGVAPPLENVADGALDLIASRSAGGVVSKLFAQRSVTPAAGSTVTVDFNGANAVNPATAALTIVGLGADQAFVNYAYRTANRTLVLYASDNVGTSTARTMAGFPLVAGSFHQARAIATPPGAPDRIRSVDVAFATVAPRTLTLGPDMGAVTVSSAATTPTLRPQAVIPAAAPYHQSWNFTITQGTGAQTRSATVQTTIAYVGGAPATVTLVVPDLSALSGYLTDWGLRPAVSMSWSAVGQSSTGFGPQGAFAEGASTTFAGRLGSVATP